MIIPAFLLSYSFARIDRLDKRRGRKNKGYFFVDEGRRRGWVRWLNHPETDAELDAIRKSVGRSPTRRKAKKKSNKERKAP
jgi:hypothetical protein